MRFETERLILRPWSESDAESLVVVYIHGKGGNAGEAEHYRSLFKQSDVIGFDYKSTNPWESKEEFSCYAAELKKKYDRIILIANSIGAFFSMHSFTKEQIEKAYFISPIVDMENLITNMMQWANVTEEELKEKEVIPTSFGEDLSWEYLQYVKNHRIDNWEVDTDILYGENDTLTSRDILEKFAGDIGATVTVMENGEHWFHTEEQMKFLDRWIARMESQKM